MDIAPAPGSSPSSPCILLTQTGLTKQIVDALELCSSFLVPIGTPAESATLPKDSAGEPASGTFGYAAIMGVLLSLSSHSRPDITFTVHQCARCTFKPACCHELELGVIS